MLASIHQGRRYIRQVVFDSQAAGDAFCFDLSQSTDAGPQQLGELFAQDQPFLLIETEVDKVSRAGPGVTSPKRVWGRVDIRYFSKDRLDDLFAHEQLERAANWFAGKTLYGIRCREFLPTGDDTMMGFQFYAGTVPFEFEVQP